MVTVAKGFESPLKLMVPATVSLDRFTIVGLGDLIIFNSEVFLGNLFGSLLELKEIDILISADNVESSSVLSSAGGDCVVAGGAQSLWSVLNTTDKGWCIFGHS